MNNIETYQTEIMDIVRNDNECQAIFSFWYSKKYNFYSLETLTKNPKYNLLFLAHEVFLPATVELTESEITNLLYKKTLNFFRSTPNNYWEVVWSEENSSEDFTSWFYAENLEKLVSKIFSLNKNLKIKSVISHEKTMDTDQIGDKVLSV